MRLEGGLLYSRGKLHPLFDVSRPIFRGDEMKIRILFGLPLFADKSCWFAVGEPLSFTLYCRKFDT